MSSLSILITDQLNVEYSESHKMLFTRFESNVRLMVWLQLLVLVKYNEKIIVFGCSSW